MTENARDGLAALSLANLSLIGWWDGLLNYTPAQAFFLEHAPPRTEYAAAFANVLLIGVVIYALIRLARWVQKRFGVAGFIFGSIPIFLLIAIPPFKSLVRLIVNRFENDVDYQLVVIGLGIIFLITAAVARQRFLTFASAALVTISPLILIEAALSISKCRTDLSAEFAPGALAQHAAQNNIPRVVWIIFDELDYRLAFTERPSTVGMPAFDRLRSESLFADKAFSPANYTQLSVPSLITGKGLIEVEPVAPRLALLDGVSAATYPTIFTSVHAMGGNVGVVGWYFPYCRLFSQDLAACSSHDMQNELSETNFTFRDSVVYQLESLFAYGYRSILGDSPRSTYRIKILGVVRKDALRDVTDPSLNLVFLHLPVPHPPHLYDRFTYKFPKRYLTHGTYLDSLALADNFMGDIRDAMITAGLWDSTTVLVSSDHPDRTSTAIDGKSDPRVPFMLKMAGQKVGAIHMPPMRTLVTKPLIEAILQAQIKSAEDAEKWLTAN